MTTDERDIRGQLAAALLSEAVEIDDLPDSDPGKKVMRIMSDTFTSAVDFLRSSFPNEPVRALMAMVWELVGNRVVPVIHGLDVPTLSIAAIQDGGTESAVIAMPLRWLARVKADIVHETGGIVFVGSQAADFYNGRIRDQTASRAAAYEAEYILTFKRLEPSYKLNEYQLGVLKEFPEGLASEKAKPLLYQRKPFVRPGNVS